MECIDRIMQRRDIIVESPVYREILEKGEAVDLEQGRKEGQELGRKEGLKLGEEEGLRESVLDVLDVRQETVRE